MLTFPLQDEKELKRQRRKQSNRESARRSRLRKQVSAYCYYCCIALPWGAAMMQMITVFVRFLG